MTDATPVPFDEPEGIGISNRAYSAECAAFRDGTRFTPNYLGESTVRQHEYPLLPAHLMWPQQLTQEPDMGRYLLRNYLAQDRVRRRRKPHADVVESVDTAGSNPATGRCAGSNPAVGTTEFDEPEYATELADQEAYEHDHAQEHDERRT